MGPERQKFYMGLNKLPKSGQVPIHENWYDRFMCENPFMGKCFLGQLIQKLYKARNIQFNSRSSQ